MELGIAGKRALITGATKGIGRAIAEMLVAEGAAVSICARTGADVETTVASLSERGKAVGLAVDAADVAAVREWVTWSAEQLGGIDVYVHGTSAKPARSTDGWVNNFEVDLMALVHGVETARSHLSQSTNGSLVAIGTTATAEHFGGGSNSYSALKAAMTNWVLGQAQVLGRKGVRCNVVSPGPILIDGGDWDQIKDRMPEFFESTEKSHPFGALGSAQDVADAVAFLVSDRARHINGVNLTVDGGVLKGVDACPRPGWTPASSPVGSPTTSTSPASNCCNCWGSTKPCGSGSPGTSKTTPPLPA